MAARDKAPPVPLAARHDVDLAGLARGGDRLAYSELVRRHGSAVRGLLRRMGAEPAAADQIARDAFLAAFEQIGEFRADIAFQAWVKQIAARLCAARWARAAAARPQIAETSAAAGGGGLDEALKALPTTERICVGLCYGGGLSHAEAAAALNLPSADVKSLVRRGLDRLRAHLEPPR